MLTIRKANPKDFQTIINIMEESTSKDEIRGFISPEEISQKFLKKLEEKLKLSDHGVIIAEKEGVPVGFAYYQHENNFIEIEEMDVIKKCQGQGIGRALIHHIEKIAKEKEITLLVTATSINAEGKPWKAYGFWVHMGFVDTREVFQGQCGLRYVKFTKQV